MGYRPALSGFKAKFPILENNFPVFAPKIPCSIIQGIASKVPKTLACLSITNAVFRQVSDRLQLEITPENQPHSFGFLCDDDQFFVDAGIAQRN
jgi:hypothetical protein